MIDEKPSRPLYRELKKLKRAKEAEKKQERMELIKKQIDDNFSKVRKTFIFEDGKINPEDDAEVQQDTDRLTEFKRELVKILVSSNRRSDPRSKEKLIGVVENMSRQARVISSDQQPQFIAGLDQFEASPAMIGDSIKPVLEEAKSRGSFEVETLFSNKTVSREAIAYADSVISGISSLRKECEDLGIDIIDDEDEKSVLGFSMKDKGEQEQYGIILPAVLSASVKSGEEGVLKNNLISSSIMATIEGNVSSENK